MTYTYFFSTHESGLDSPINGVYEVPMSGFDSESEAYEAFLNLPFYEEAGGFDFWQGSVISVAITCKESNK